MRECFADRTVAGAAVGQRLAGSRLLDPLVLGVARGGVVVAFEVARSLAGELDVLVVRKLGHPRQRELGLGALTEVGDPVYDDAGLAAAGLSRADLGTVVVSERAECRRRLAAYRAGRPPVDVSGRDVVVVDDGIATGVTARAALRALRAEGARRLVLAAPVASPTALRRLAQDADADEVVAVLVPPDLGAVNRWYGSFDQTGDDEVVRLLETRRPL